jgi:hypothetical protein
VDWAGIFSEYMDYMAVDFKVAHTFLKYAPASTIIPAPFSSE